MDSLFVVGRLFDSHGDFVRTKSEYEQMSNCVLIISKSDKLSSTDKRSSIFMYNRLTLSCKAGKERKCTSKGMRFSSTIKRNCPFQVKIVLCGEKYKVAAANAVHENHNTDLQTYLHYSENMRLKPEEVAVVVEKVKCRGNKQLIKNELMNQRNGRPVALKSIHNIASKIHKEIHQLIAEATELEKLLENMKKVPNARIKVAVDENNELLSIFFQDPRMAMLFDKFPDLLLIDATYKLNKRRIPLFIILIVDGNGESEIACLWFIKSESIECITPMIEAFKEVNPSWVRTKVIISDKDLAERKVFSQMFNGIPIQICLFHALRNFNREITTTKREITVVQRELVLELLSKMAYSRSVSQYEILYRELVEMKLPLVIDYFNTNWHPIRSEWTLHGKNEWSNYMNYTNNRVESLNQKLKIIGTHYASMLDFFQNIIQSYAVISSEKDIKVVKQSMKVLRVRFDDSTLQKFNELLTPYVFDKLLYEYERRNKVHFTLRRDGGAVMTYGEYQEILTDNESCSCGFFKTMNLPCRHIFKFLNEENSDLFVPDLCARRWHKSYYHLSHPALNSILPTSTIPISCTRVKVPEEIDKFKNAAKVTKEINALMSTMSTGQFQLYMDRLNSFRGEISKSDATPSSYFPSNETTIPADNSYDAPLDLSHPNSDINMTTNAIQVTQPFVASETSDVSAQELITNLPRTSMVASDAGSYQDERCHVSPSVARNVLEIRQIKLPSQNYRVGRPKGSGRTVVGTRRKDISKKQPTVSKKQPTVSKKQPTVSKKQTTVSKKQTTVSKKQTTVSKKQTTVLYDRVTRSSKAQKRGATDHTDVTSNKKVKN